MKAKLEKIHFQVAIFLKILYTYEIL